jgi:subfamily B ATP-binding cassette protein MsbA
MSHDIMMLGRVTSDMTRIPKEIFSIVVLAVVLFVMDWQLAIVAFVVYPLALVPTVKFGRKMKNIASKNLSSMGAITSLTNQSASGIRIVKAFGMQGYESKRFNSISNNFTRLCMKNIKIRGLAPVITQMIGSLAFALTIWYAAVRIGGGTLLPESFMSFFAALLMLYKSAKPLSGMQFNIIQGSAVAQSIFDVLDTEPEARKKEGDIDIDRVQKIIFKDVCFEYNEGEPILRDINLEVEKGEKIAIVGPSGAGKTTFVNLIPRFYDVTGGDIIIDDVSIRNISIDSLRGQISIVSQDVILFDDTIYKNIAYGDDSKSHEEVMEAARLANASAFIEAFPNGYETGIGEAGHRLSGGQKQRLSIARAILKDAPILILDEATSSLDTESEYEIQKALENLMKDKKTFIIAHRLSTIKKVDRIIVLKDGAIEEIGSHDELLTSGGLYSRLYNSQFHISGFEENIT